MNLSQLYYFCKLAELQHYTQAAQELYITQPSLSGAISTLESELGVDLFQKRGRNVYLTKYGKEFYQYVSAALRELDKGIEVAKEHAGKMGGQCGHRLHPHHPGGLSAPGDTGVCGHEGTQRHL